MKPLLAIALITEGALLGLVIIRTLKRNRSISLFFAIDVIFLFAIYFELFFLYTIFSYILILTLFLFILTLFRDVETLLYYVSSAVLALSSILISLFLLPDIYYSINIAMAFIVSLLSIVNVTRYLQRVPLPLYDRVFLCTFYPKIIVSIMFILVSFYGRSSMLFLMAQPAATMMVAVAGFGVLFNGELFQVRIRPSPELLTRLLLLITLLLYGVIVVYLDRYSTQGFIFFYSRIILIFIFTVGATVLIMRRDARQKVKFFLIRNLYASRYEPADDISQVFAILATCNEDMTLFLKEVAAYLHTRYPLKGISIHIPLPEGPVTGSVGKIRDDCFSLEFTEDIGSRLARVIYCKDGAFDEDDRINLRLISLTVMRTAWGLYLARKKMLMDRIEVADRLRLFILHDLKNICSTLAMLEKNISTIPSDRAGEFLKDLRGTLPGLLKRARGILDATRVLRGRDWPEVFSLVDVMDEVILGFHKREIFHIDMEGSGLVYADREKVMAAIENIIKNAHDKSFDDKELEVNIEGRGKDGCYNLIIRDNGSPIEEEDLGKIFEPFFTTKKGGMGVGLYQAKEFIESQGGTITLENSQNGVAFTIRLPTKADMSKS